VRNDRLQLSEVVDFSAVEALILLTPLTHALIFLAHALTR